MEKPINFQCEGSELFGILNVPNTLPPSRGIVFIVADGPQYRVGAQRQFVTLARTMEQAGYASIRFDYRGMGDSEGIHRGFEHVDEDIKAAVNTLLAHCTNVKEVVLWGECDSAAAVLFYAHKDTRIKGICIANPWVRTEEGRAKTIVKHYYQSRLADKQFWKKLLSGQFDFSNSISSLWNNVIKSFKTSNALDPVQHDASDTLSQQPLPVRLAHGLSNFNGQVILILSGNDWIAKEFLEIVAASPLWQNLLQNERLVRHEIPGADHSFSRRASRDELLRLNIEWLKSW